MILPLIVLTALVASAAFSLAEESGADAVEMARKLQDPLGEIKALITNNDINWNTGSNEHEVSYGFQLQPMIFYNLPNA